MEKKTKIKKKVKEQVVKFKLNYEYLDNIINSLNIVLSSNDINEITYYHITGYYFYNKMLNEIENYLKDNKDDNLLKLKEKINKNIDHFNDIKIIKINDLLNETKTFYNYGT